MVSNVIKARAASGHAQTTLIKRDIQCAASQAQQIIERANQEAQEIQEAAHQQAKQILDEARKTGYDSGLAKWNELLAGSLRQRDRFISENETALVQLAVRIAEKIIGEEVQVSPERIVSLVQQAGQSLRRAKNIVIRVHPNQSAALLKNVVDLNGLLGPGKEIEVTPDENVALNGCIFETEIGTIDAQLETQLHLLERALLGEQP
jgi:type III secretion system HrpE/YscL family protein